MIDNLYIIGNGFDLHHGLRTSYANFRDDYVKKKRSRLWKSLLQIYGEAPHHDQWWWNFEEMLGRIDYISLMNSNNGNGLPLGPTIVQNILNNIPVLFGDWVKTINDNVEPDESLRIITNSYFFTFNYTLVLEKAYLIDTKNIWHIHESIKKPNDLVVGHDFDNSQLFQFFLDYRRKRPYVNQDIADKINLAALNGAKNVQDRISQNEDNFYQYAGIKHFIVMGLSFNNIDMPYIEKIVSVNKNISDTDWILYWHTDGEFSVMNDKLQKLGVNGDKIKQKKW